MADPFGSIIQIIVNLAQPFGIYAIVALGLNLEYGFTGIPNFGKVFFIGLGAFITGATVSHIISSIVGNGADICSGPANFAKQNFALTSPGVVAGLFLLAILVSGVVTGAFGYLLSYPALRLREDYLGILLIASGEMLRVFALALPQNLLACQSDSVNAISKPFDFLGQFVPPNAPSLAFPFGWVTASILTNGTFAILVLLITLGCYIVVSRLTRSPYGRMLKSVRDDEPASISLGKDPAKIRGQVMIIGSAMAGIGGALFAFYLESVATDSFIPLFTFIIWAILLLGGAANNRGIILGSLVYVAILEFTFQVSSWGQSNFPQFRALFTRAPIDLYGQTMALGVIVILIILFRPQGILPEKPIKTPAWDVLKNDTDSDDKKPG